MPASRSANVKPAEVFREALLSRIRVEVPPPETEAAQHLADFIGTVNPYYERAPHTELLCEYLEKVERGEIRRLIINLPPRHSKSYHVSDHFPAWFLGRNPRKKVILASHTAELAYTSSRKNRDHFKDTLWPFPKAKLSDGVQAATKWETHVGGECFAVGVGGAIPGHGADVLIIDDPIGSPDDADSPVIREKTWRWYQQAARPRLQPKGAIILMHCMTGDTAVTMGDGSWKYLQDIRAGDEVLAWTDDVLVPRKVLNWQLQGEDDVFIIKTGNNSVKSNARHPFLVERKAQALWVRAKDLRVGDKLIVSATVPGKDKASLSSEEAWLLGYMFGDGWVTVRKNRVGYVTCVAQSVREEENSYVIGLFNTLFSVSPKVTSFGYIRTEVARVGRWMLERGLTGNAHTKRLPAYLYLEPLPIRLSFLRGVAAADGHTDARGRITIGVCNEELAKDLRHLARSCGFHPTNLDITEKIQQPPHSKQPVSAKLIRFSWLPERVEAAFTKSKIRKIIEAGRELVYDLQVEESECFLADGVTSHNTRWNEDDVAGRILASNDKDNWTVLRLPAICEEPETDPLGRKKGEPLWPDWYPENELPSVERDEIDRRGWLAQYQQRPVHEVGNMFHRDWWQRYHLDVMQLQGLQPSFSTVDSSFKDGVENDFSVIATWGVKDGKAYLMDLWRAQVQYPQLVQACRDVFNKWHVPLVIEDKASGQSLVQSLGQGDASHPAIPVIAQPIERNQSKVSRAERITRYVEAKSCFLPEDAPWAGDFIEEHASFPNGKHDDQVDTTSMALRRIFLAASRPQEFADFRYKGESSDARRQNWRERQKVARQEAAEEYYRLWEEEQELRRGTK